MSLLANSNAIESGGYNIDRSLRFRSSASAYLSRTPVSSGSRTTFTWSGWVKRGTLGVRQAIFSSGNGVNASCDLVFNPSGAGDNFQWEEYDGSTNYRLATAAQYRDPSAWYHIIVAVDTTQATDTNRIKLYVNGVQVTAFATTAYPAQNFAYYINTSTYAAKIGIGTQYSSNYFDGYLAEVNFIDGQALTPSSFGQTDAVTGVWTPKKYTGTYGTNGFYLPFSDNTSATTLAYDKSGNGNNWTANNISTTAGATYDSMTDVPTLTSATAANFATFNPIDNVGGATFSNGNLQIVTGTTAVFGGRATMAVSSGKYYWEMTPTSNVSGADCAIGIDSAITPITSSSTGLGYSATSYSMRSNGQKVNNSFASAYGSSYTDNDVIGVALDLDAGTLVYYKNGTSQGTAFTGITGTFTPAMSDLGGAQGVTLVANFGQRPFSYTPPTGFKALNTFNLPDPTIKKPNQYMDATTYGGSASQQTITTNLTGLDFAWIKNRTTARDHVLVDRVRGGSPLLTLYSNQTYAEDNTSPNYNPTSFTTSGIVLEGNKLGINNSGENFVMWGWKESATAGFDIVTYTGTGVARTVSHSLGIAPKMIIVKQRNSTSDWTVYTTIVDGSMDYLYLNLTSAKADSSLTAPTSSVFYLGTSIDTNGNGSTYVAYLFAEIPGFSKFGSYTGNGSADGPFVYCGFRPRYIMIKQSSAAGEDWIIQDTARKPYNDSGTSVSLYADSSAAEVNTASQLWDVTSNGFKLRASGGGVNTSGGTYLFTAFAENPFKYSLAR